MNNDSIQEISVADLRHIRRSGIAHTLLDVREHLEVAAGMIDGALHIPLGELQSRVSEINDRAKPVYIYCASGVRSLRAAHALERLGFKAASVAGGYKAYVAADCQSGRYSRQMVLPQVGAEGQAKMEASHIALIGVGGIGSVAGLYLAAAGVGELTLIDPDCIEESNLHRQISYDNSELGLIKVEQAAKRFKAINPRLKVNIYKERLNRDNGESILKNANVILDGSDNFETRFAVNDLSIKLNKALIHASVHQFSGLLGVFNIPGCGSLRTLFPEEPPADLIADCSQAGVLGPVVGIVGSLAANEALKLILGLRNAVEDNVFMLEFESLALRSMRV